jgi:hypothetical protein
MTKKRVDKWFRAEAKIEAQHDGRDHRNGPHWYSLGYCDGQDRETLMWIVEAGRQVCGMAPATARKVLLEAIKCLDKREPKRGVGDDYEIGG